MRQTKLKERIRPLTNLKDYHHVKDYRLKHNRRWLFLQMITDGFSINPIIAILGPRQSGKATLTRHYIDIVKGHKKIHYFDLEDPNDLTALKSPKAVLEKLEGLIVIDEIQRLKELFPILRVLIDRVHAKQHYLILGSASRDLIKQSSETLA